jgi:hypothetical protein
MDGAAIGGAWGALPCATAGTNEPNMNRRGRLSPESEFLAMLAERSLSTDDLRAMSIPQRQECCPNQG